MLKTTSNNALSTPEKIREWVGEISVGTVEVLPTTDPPEYIDGRPLRGCRARGVLIKKVRNFMSKT